MKYFRCGLLIAFCCMLLACTNEEITQNEKPIEVTFVDNDTLTAGFVYDITNFDYADFEPVESTIVESSIVEEYELTCDECEIPEPNYIRVSSTAYYDAYGYGYGALGPNYPLIEGLTVAGKREWLGKSLKIWKCNSDGTVGDFVGYFEFRDTGYGAPLGYGESSILPGKTLGSIEAGLCIDIYFETYEKCCQWGRKELFIEIIDSEG